MNDHAALQTEIERLTHELEEAQAMTLGQQSIAEMRQREIDRLRARLAGEREPPHCSSCSCGVSVVDRLARKIEDGPAKQVYEEFLPLNQEARDALESSAPRGEAGDPLVSPQQEKP